jgi:biotin transport system permease protein
VITLYRSGHSLLHKTPAGVKLLLLAVSLLAISLWARDPVAVAMILTAAIAGFFVAGLRRREVANLLWSYKLLVLVVLAPQLIFMPWQIALVNAGRLVTCVLLAMLFTVTTRNQELIELIERWAKPVRRLGLRPQTLGLLVAMTLNSIALLGQFVVVIREAQLARGMRPRHYLMAVPLLVLSLKHADDYAEALAARGVEL